MVTKTTRYALRILGYLVDHPGKRIQGQEIAQATGIPSNYLSKILSRLRKRGYVDARKGWGGGFLLCNKALSVSLAEVLDAFRGTMAVDQRCVFELRNCDRRKPCPLHNDWERVRNEYTGMLSRLSVQDLKSRTAGSLFSNEKTFVSFEILKGSK